MQKKDNVVIRGGVSTPLVNSLFQRAGIESDKKPTTWENLDDLYQQLGGMLHGIIEELKDLITQTNQLSQQFKIDIPDSMHIVRNGIETDVQSYVKRLKEVRALYSGRSGIVKLDNTKDYILMKDVWMKFTTIHADMTTSFLNPLMQLTEDFNMMLIEQKKLQTKQTTADIETIGETITDAAISPAEETTETVSEKVEQ